MIARLRRREFIALLGGAAAVPSMLWPPAARAQQPAMPVIGFLDPRSPDGMTERLRGFRQGLKDTGYVDGENVAIEYRWAEGQNDRLPALADELVRQRVAMIAAHAPAIVDLKIATRHPAQLLQPAFERHSTGLGFRLVLGLRHQHARRAAAPAPRAATRPRSRAA